MLSPQSHIERKKRKNPRNRRTATHFGSFTCCSKPNHERIIATAKTINIPINMPSENVVPAFCFSLSGGT